MILDSDSSVIDWIGYPISPPDKYLAKLEHSVKGIDTFRSLAERMAGEPKNIEVVFKLAQKLALRYDDENQKKALDLYKKVVALDPEGTMGSTRTESENKQVTYTEYAEFSMGDLTIFSREGDPKPTRAFITKYPKSELLKSAYENLARYYQDSGSKEEAAQFFEEFVAIYPQEPEALNSYVSRIIRDKGDIEKGIILGEKIKELTKWSPDPAYLRNLANLYILKGDKAKAEEIYGKVFMDGRVSRLPFDLLNYANFWANQKMNIDSAVEMAALALKLAPDNVYLVQAVAKIFCQSGQAEKALQIYGPEFIKTHPDETNTLAGYAWFWSGQGINLDSALEASKKAVELVPESPECWDILGRVYSKLNKHAAALEAAEKALKLAEEAKDDYSIQRAKQSIELIKKSMPKKDAK